MFFRLPQTLGFISYCITFTTIALAMGYPVAALYISGVGSGILFIARLIFLAVALWAIVIKPFQAFMGTYLGFYTEEEMRTRIADAEVILNFITLKHDASLP